MFLLRIFVVKRKVKYHVAVTSLRHAFIIRITMTAPDQHPTGAPQMTSSMYAPTSQHLPFELPAQLSGYLSPSSGLSSCDEGGSPPPRPDADDVYITDLGPHDICCGRGTTCNENPGNILFRTIVSRRKMDYVATKSRKAKSKIARELIREIRSLEPPGRFLTRVDGPEAKRADCPPGKEVWKVAGDDIALEKIKQSLRRSERGGGGGGEDKEATTAAGPKKRSAPPESTASASAAASAAASAGSPPVSMPSILPQTIAATCTSASSAPVLPPAAAVVSPRQQSQSQSGNVAAAARAERSLRDWLWSRQWNTSTRAEREANVVTRVQVAHCIAVAAKEMVETNSASVPSAAFDSDSVVIVEGDGFDGTCSGGFLVRILSGRGSNYEDNIEVQTLISLGRVFMELFGGGTSLLKSDGANIRGGMASVADGSHTITDEGGSRKKKSTTVSPSLDGSGRPEDFCVDLHESGMPISLCMVVASLLRANDNDTSYPERYSSVDELIVDLDLLRSKPSQYLFDNDAVVPHLECFDTRQSQLYGREEELSSMAAALERVGQMGSRSEVLLLRGFSGVGKSHLVQALAKKVSRDPNGAYLSGKFDDKRSAPLSALSSAFDEFILSLLIESGQDDTKKATLDAIRSAVGSGDGMVLAELIPSLRLISAHGNGEDDTGNASADQGISSVQSPSDALNRMIFFFTKMVRAISSINTSLVLGMDDLQWADTASLALLAMLVTDAEASLLLVGCYRDNEVSPDHPLITNVGKIENAKVNVETIDVEPLALGPTNEMISDMLHLLPRLTLPLSTIVHRKTLGNSLFALRLLSSLFEDGFLSYSPRSRRWTWDINVINSMSIADDLVSLLVRKLAHLPIELQRLLCMASCLGHQFEENVVIHICVEDSMRSSAETLLDIAEEEGFVYKDGSAYFFAHDQIQSAIYSMCAPENVGGCLHLMIGKVLLSSCSDEEIEKNLFTIVDQINLGKEGLVDHSEKIEMAHLHLRAGEKAMAAAGFVSATQYLTGALSLLDEHDWISDYSLSLDIYSASAESFYAIGDFEKVQTLAEAVVLHGKCLSDKLRAYRSYIQALGSESKLNEAISVSTDVLGQMGVVIPAEVNDAAVGAAMMDVQGLLAVTPPESIIGLNELKDQNMIFALKILTLMTTYAYFGGRKELFPIITAHMVSNNALFPRSLSSHTPFIHTIPYL